MSRTMRNRPEGWRRARDDVARVSSWFHVPWINAVNPLFAYRSTFFHTFKTDPHVVSTTMHPARRNRSIVPTGTPNAGRITTSSGSRDSMDAPPSLPSKKRIPNSRSFPLTLGLWMISPVMNRFFSGNFSRVS
jgi:hypothetical protein